MCFFSSLISSIKSICKFPSESESSRIISGLRWIGLFSSEKVKPCGGNLLDTLCAQLETLMKYEDGERDLVMLQHKFIVEWADGSVVRLLQHSFTTPHCSDVFANLANPHIYTGGIWRPIGSFRDGAHSWFTMRDSDATGAGRRIQGSWGVCSVYQGDLRSYTGDLGERGTGARREGSVSRCEQGG